VTSLRRQLGDDPKNPTYIETLPRLGYRMIASVTSEPASPSATPALSPKSVDSGVTKSKPNSKTRLWLFAIAVIALCVAVAAALINSAHRSAEKKAADQQQAQRSVAVLPFLDLTEGMKNGEFADGITEELIDKLSHVDGLRVPSPTASFFYKDKQTPVDQIAKALGVAYVLDGSVRKDHDWVRVDVRLVRAQSGYVVWSHTYDQPMTSILAIQDDIAGKVTQSLKATLGNAADSTGQK
jgi:transcriptional activator of cad operon